MAVIKLDGGYNAFPISYKRGNPIPLDQSDIWYDYADMVAYAKTDPVAYVGQILCYVNEREGEAEAYIILNTDGDIQRLGSASVDDRSIEIDSGGQLALKDWGVQYYTYIPAVKDADGNVITPSGYKLQKVDKNHPWMPGLQPRVASENGQMVLAWYEQNLESLDGVEATIQALKESVQGLEAEVGDPEDFEKDLPATGLYALLEQKVDVQYYAVPVLDADGNLTYDGDGNLITEQIAGTLLDPNDKAKLDALYDGKGSVDASNVENLAEWVKENRNKVEGLYPSADAEKLSKIEDEAEKNIIQDVDTTFFTISTPRVLNLKDIPQSKITGLSKDLEMIRTQTESLDKVLNGYVAQDGSSIKGLRDTVNTILTTYVSVDVFNKTVGNLEDLLASPTTIVEDIVSLKERLTWQEMSK